MRNILQTLIVIAGTVLMCSFSQPTVKEDPVIIPITAEAVTVSVKMEPIMSSPKTVEVETVVKEEPEVVMSQEDIDLIALVTMAEAEGESELGKRLVISTILNRMDSEQFPDTVSDVIYQKNQFTSMWNGRSDRCYVDDDIRNLVEEELVERTNTDVLFFHAGKYSKYGIPLLVEGNHYFSS